uniref:Uncharacterized protein n=1 Tax=Rhizophagus irregularis (strain DAOM 181602 / DAOM 197198 / MUCL 43194) TaxID=747089 RepID=U9U1B8_RHIID
MYILKEVGPRRKEFHVKKSALLYKIHYAKSTKDIWLTYGHFLFIYNLKSLILL